MYCNHSITLQWFEASVITMQNAKAGRWQVEGLLELHKSSLDNLIRPDLKSKNKERAKDIAQCVRYWIDPQNHK